MRNYRITDKYGQTAVVLGHTPEHAAERCYKMYRMRAARVELITDCQTANKNLLMSR